MDLKLDIEFEFVVLVVVVVDELLPSCKKLPLFCFYFNIITVSGPLFSSAHAQKILTNSKS